MIPDHAAEVIRRPVPARDELVLRESGRADRPRPREVADAVRVGPAHERVERTRAATVAELAERDRHVGGDGCDLAVEAGGVWAPGSVIRVDRCDELAERIVRPV